jgi:hypothetical protein
MITIESSLKKSFFYSNYSADIEYKTKLRNNMLLYLFKQIAKLTNGISVNNMLTCVGAQKLLLFLQWTLSDTVFIEFLKLSVYVVHVVTG